MKRIVETTEDSGLAAMLGARIEIWCGVYIYVGELVGVNDDHVELHDASIVYETGDLSAPTYKNAQRIRSPWRVMLRAIESWGPAK